MQRSPIHRFPRFPALIGLLFGASCGSALAQTKAVGALALLEQHCLDCHGVATRKGGLDLSTRETLLTGGDDGAAVFPGDPEKSLLYQLITHQREPHMPRKARKLSDADTATIANWIRAGAVYDRPLRSDNKQQELWWSLRPLARPEPPNVRDASWCTTPIDRFVLAQLETKKMKPAPPADKRTLLRRITFDLTGLPPTPQEVSAFLSDESPDAFAKVVDRLLASPHYGERWARHWLDIVHYADTHGHDQDRPRPNAWPYRDYCIAAFNNDKPYSRFVEEQLAGDVLYPDDPQATVATGFIAAGPWDESSQIHIMGDTIDKKIAQNLDRDDMVTTTMATFVSTTANCARCHAHKFDPISQADYYSLQACFAGVDRADRPYEVDAKTHAARQALLKQKTALDARGPELLASLSDPAVLTELADWEKEAQRRVARWTVLEPLVAISSKGSVLTRQPDSSLVSSGPRPEVDTYTVSTHTDVTKITAVRVEVMADDSLPYKGPGRNDNGNLHLSEFEVYAAPATDPGVMRRVPLQNPTADFNQQDWGIARAIDGDTATAWGIYPSVGKSHLAVFETTEPVGFDSGTVLVLVLRQLHGRGHLIGRLRLSVTTAPLPVRAIGLPDDLAIVLALAPERRTDQQKTELAIYHLKQRVEYQLAALPKPSLVYAGTHDFPPQKNFKPAVTPRPIHMLRRGDLMQPGDPAGPGSLSCVPGLKARFELPDSKDEGARRAALARWITDPRNVLTWRSIVNRMWQYHFGQGIVDSPSDFGHMGSLPSHPELLDWLATTLLESGGSIKKLQRLIVTSAVYRQSSRHEPAYAELDFGNRYLWRMNRLRLDAESVRDAILQITGKLDLTMGGPGVKQFYYEDFDPGRTPIVDYTRFDVDNPANYRRSIYRYLYRTLPDPFMDAMDCPDGSQLAPRRNVSVTALQALAVLNDPFVVRQSEHLAAKLAAMSDTTMQIDSAYQLALSRSPTPTEAAMLKAYAEKHGMANVCRLIFNCNEFMFVE